MSTLLQLSNLHKSYGRDVIFDGANFVVSEGQKIAVIGRNGAGKSTMLRLIAGQEAADQGEVRRFPDLRLGYLEQLSPFQESETVMGFLQRESGAEEWKCAKAAGSFSLKGGLLEAPVASLSGGWQMRAKMAALILHEPNLLLLDEPTNYLDLGTQLLLEKFLRSWRGAFLAVSHDREFLKNVCTETADVARGSITFYAGPLEEYFAYRARREAETERHNRNVEAQRQHLQAFVDRFRYKASKASQAQSKLKAIAKLESIDIETSLATVAMRIPPVAQPAGNALRVEGLTVGYAERAVVSAISLEIRRGEHIAILGDNGAGKSTILKTLAGDLQPLAGRFKWDPKAVIGWYGQHTQDELDPADTVSGYLEARAGIGTTQEQVLAMAGNFLFRDDDLGKRLSVLSGGERSRLALAGLFLGTHHVLILDEPTSHLDVETSEALGTALREFAGTIVFVSHDRTFVNLVASGIVEVKDGVAKRFPCTYEEYVWQLRRDLGLASEDASPETAVRPLDVTTPVLFASPRDTKKEAGRARLRYEELREAKRMAQQSERSLLMLRREREGILKEFLENPTGYSPERFQRLQEVERMISEEEGRWMLWEQKREDVAKGAE